MEEKMYTVNELPFGVEFDKKEIRTVIGYGQERKEFFIGTIIGDALESCDIVTDEEEFKDMLFTIKREYNTYNWNGNTNRDFYFAELENEFGEEFIYLSIHVGVDIRAGYTVGLLLNETFDSFVTSCTENTSGFYGEVNGQDWAIDGDAFGEELRVYNYETDEDYIAYDSVFSFTEKDFNMECENIIKEIIEDNDLEAC